MKYVLIVNGLDEYGMLDQEIDDVIPIYRKAGVPYYWDTNKDLVKGTVAEWNRLIDVEDKRNTWKIVE